MYQLTVARADHLSAAFDISKSAFSQRVSAIESKLATTALDWQGLAD